MKKNKYEPAGRSFTEVIRNILNEPPTALIRENENSSQPVQMQGEMHGEEVATKN